MSLRIDEYMESTVMTATPYQLHLMVIDGALRHALAADAFLRLRRIDKAHLSFANARRFVTEMIAGLDSTRMSETVDRLKALFLFIHRRLVGAERERDQGQLADAISILREHRETWMALGEQLRRESGASAVSAGEYGSWAS